MPTTDDTPTAQLPTATDDTPALRGVPGPGRATRRPLRQRWRSWRRSRPFWGGVLVAAGGAEILLSVRAPLPVILHIGPQGLAGYLVPLILLICGVLLLAHPPQRLFYAVVSILLALASWLTSNLGGFLVGMLLALVGGCLAFAWSPTRHPHSPPAAPEAEPPPVDASAADPAPAPLPQDRRGHPA